MTGTIYMISSPNTPLVYIGSTTMKLSQRFIRHKAVSNVTRSKIIIDMGDAVITAIDNIEDEDKEPYEVYTGPKEEITPLQAQIESIQNDKHLSDWGKRSKIEEATNRFNKESLGKTY